MSLFMELISLITKSAIEALPATSEMSPFITLNNCENSSNFVLRRIPQTRLQNLREHHELAQTVSPISWFRACIF